MTSTTHPSSLVLYGNTMWSSPYVLYCFVALREKGVPFEVRNVALEQGAHREPGFTKQSLTSRVPVLADGDFSVSESSAIVEYLDERLPPPAYPRLLPADLRDRARARQLVAWLGSDLMPIREERSAEYVFYAHDRIPAFAPLSADGVRAAQKLVAAAERLVPEAGGNLFGAWSIADTALAMMLQRLVKTHYDLPKKLVTFADAQWERPSVKEFVAKERPAFHASI